MIWKLLCWQLLSRLINSIIIIENIFKTHAWKQTVYRNFQNNVMQNPSTLFPLCCKTFAFRAWHHSSTAVSLCASINPTRAHTRRHENFFFSPLSSLRTLARPPVFTSAAFTMTYISAGPSCSRGKETRESRTLIVQEVASAAGAWGRAGERRTEFSQFNGGGGFRQARLHLHLFL